MPNVLDIEPVRAFARRASGKISDQRIAARFERLAIEYLMSDTRNFRAATAGELEDAPGWTRAALARGDRVDVFKLCRSASQRLHNLARRLADTCKFVATDWKGHNAVVINDARDFLEKIERASFEATRRKASYFARVLRAWTDTRDVEPVCEERSIGATRGKRWTRVTSVGALRLIGAEFQNCLARTVRTNGYGAGLTRGLMQFWVLREESGKGLIVVMADAPRPIRLNEVRGPRNARIPDGDPDLAVLARAIGIRPPPPPPQLPPTIALRLLSTLPCRCMLCDSSPTSLALRRAAGAL
jgi:hypothetical protein